uniref:Transcription initiation factor IIA gamma subunit C-terminal domain-containing protein n=2 Tax=Sus scrofa TaxID=9823 RepID=A0A4X1W6S3_PIG
VASQLQRNFIGSSLQKGPDKGSVHMYRFCDKVWAFVLNAVEFTEMIELIKVDKVTIVAYDGKNTGFNTTEWIEKKWLANTFFCH